MKSKTLNALFLGTLISGAPATGQGQQTQIVTTPSGVPAVTYTFNENEKFGRKEPSVTISCGKENFVQWPIGDKKYLRPTCLAMETFDGQNFCSATDGMPVNYSEEVRDVMDNNLSRGWLETVRHMGDVHNTCIQELGIANIVAFKTEELKNLLQIKGYKEQDHQRIIATAPLNQFLNTHPLADTAPVPTDSPYVSAAEFQRIKIAVEMRIINAYGADWKTRPSNTYCPINTVIRACRQGLNLDR